MLNIIEAAKLACAGRRIRRSIWPEKRYLVPSGREDILLEVITRSGYEPYLDDLLADNWEVVE